MDTWAFVIISICFYSINGPGQELFLDLNAREVRENLKAQTRGCSGGRLAAATHREVGKPELTLSLEIESLNPRHFKIDDEIVSEVRLTNIGSKPVIFPWSWDYQAVYGKNCEWPKVPEARGLRGMLRLEFDNGAGQVEFLASHGLYGISSDSGSYRWLAPNESVRIKFGAKAYLPQLVARRVKKEPGSKSPEQYVVTASFDLDDSSLWNPYKELRSTNQIPVSIHED